MHKQLISIFVGTVCLIVSGCNTEQNSTMREPQAVPVIAAAPVIKDVTIDLESIGTLSPSVFVEVRPQINGLLQDVLISEGEWVKEGTPLFKVDPVSYEIKVQEAKAHLAMDHANFNAVEKKAVRFENLAQKDLMSQTEWDELEAQVEKARATIALDQARLNSALLDLDHCTLKSPVEGRVGKLDAHSGLLVADGQATPLVTLSKMDPLIVEFTVTEKEFPKIQKESLKIELSSLCSTGLCQVGTVTFLDNHFDSKTGLLLVRGKVQNPDHTLRPGQTVRVRIPIAVEENAKLIPQKAIRYNQQGPYVYVVQKDMTVALRQIELGIEHGSDQIILSELDPSEFIVIDGHLRLSPGTKVEIKS